MRNVFIEINNDTCEKLIVIVILKHEERKEKGLKCKEN